METEKRQYTLAEIEQLKRQWAAQMTVEWEWVDIFGFVFVLLGGAVVFFGGSLFFYLDAHL